MPPQSELANVYIDGTETQVVLNFCEQFNCTVKIDSCKYSKCILNIRNQDNIASPPDYSIQLMQTIGGQYTRI